MNSIYYSEIVDRILLISMLESDIVRIDYGDDRIYYRSIDNVEFLIGGEFELIGYFHE